MIGKNRNRGRYFSAVRCAVFLMALLMLTAANGCNETTGKDEAVTPSPSMPIETPLAEADKIRTVYEPETDLVSPPTVVLTMESVGQLNSLLGEKPAQAAWFTLNQDGSVRVGEESIFLAEAFSLCYGKVIPVFEVPSVETMELLNNFAKQSKAMDFMVASEDSKVLSKMTITGVVKGLIEKDTELDPASAWEAGANFVVLTDPSVEKVSDFQLKWISVMVKGTGSDEDTVKKALSIGADQVIVKDAKKAYDAFEANENQPQYCRKTFLTAHRGYHETVPENTVPSFLKAVEAGADAIECDVYVTKDGELVICHDEDVSSYTDDATGSVETFTREEIKAMRLKGSEFVPDAVFAFLDEFLDEMQTNTVHLVIEIKTEDPSCVERIKALAEEKQMMDRISIISFHAEQIFKTREILPGVPASLLYNVGVTTPDKYLVSFYRYSKGVNMGYSPSMSFTKDAVQAFRHRGILINRWTADGMEDMIAGERMGVTMLTSNTVNLRDQLENPYDRIGEKQ